MTDTQAGYGQKQTQGITHVSFGSQTEVKPLSGSGPIRTYLTGILGRKDAYHPIGAYDSARLANLGAPQIVYLSCDPSTLARDLAVLTASERKTATEVTPAHRYEITDVQLFDLFPQTFHIETLVRLRRIPFD